MRELISGYISGFRRPAQSGYRSKHDLSNPYPMPDPVLNPRVQGFEAGLVPGGLGSSMDLSCR